MYQLAPQQAPGMDDFIDRGRLLRAVMRSNGAIIVLAFAISLVTRLLVYATEPVFRATQAHSGLPALRPRMSRSPAWC